jgi:hypothetical protein
MTRPTETSGDSQNATRARVYVETHSEAKGSPAPARLGGAALEQSEDIVDREIADPLLGS